MKIYINTIIFICGIYCVAGLNVISTAIESEQIINKFDFTSNVHSANEQQVENEETQRLSRTENESTDGQLTNVVAYSNATKTIETNGNESSPSTNLVQKIVSALRKKPIKQKEPNKQLFGGKLPPFIERIIQRIQNYFSVYNPPDYFENSRPPPVTSVDEGGITIICTNADNESLSCNEMNEESSSSSNEGDTAEDCDTESHVVESAGNEPSTVTQPEPAEDSGYNIVVTHTVVHDNMVNVYSPNAADPTNNHIVSNVVVILEPSAAEYSPQQPEPTSNRNKFYVYVNPTEGANKSKKDTLQEDDDGTENGASFQPYSNATYTVIIRGDKLEEYSNNIDNVDNSELNPEIAIYIENSTRSKATTKENCAHSDEFSSNRNINEKDCEREINDEQEDLVDETLLVGSGSVTDRKSNTKDTNAPDIPNLNLVLAPPPPPPRENEKKKPCSKKKVENNPYVEYYILKPDSGNINIAETNKNRASRPPTYVHSQETPTKTIAATYLPPKSEDEFGNDESNSSSESTSEFSTFRPIIVTELTTNRFPLLYNLFKRRPEEPRQL